MKNLILFEDFNQEDLNEKKKWGSSEKGLMHELLKVPEDKKIEDVYKDSPRKLAKDLLNAVKKSKVVPQDEVRTKATSMLAFAANWPNDGKNSLMDKALSAIKNIEIPGVPKSE
jgi:hypothetical protein